MTRWCESWCLNISVSFSAFSFLSTPCQITFHTSHCLSDIDEKGMNRMPICCITHCHKFHTCNYIWQRFLGMCYSCSLFWKEKNLLSFLCLQHWWQHDVLMTRNLLRPFFSNEISSRFMCRNLYHISLLGWQNQLQLNFFFMNWTKYMGSNMIIAKFGFSHDAEMSISPAWSGSWYHISFMYMAQLHKPRTTSFVYLYDIKAHLHINHRWSYIHNPNTAMIKSDTFLVNQIYSVVWTSFI